MTTLDAGLVLAASITIVLILMVTLVALVSSIVRETKQTEAERVWCALLDGVHAERMAKTEGETAGAHEQVSNLAWWLSDHQVELSDEQIRVLHTWQYEARERTQPQRRDYV